MRRDVASSGLSERAGEEASSDPPRMKAETTDRLTANTVVSLIYALRLAAGLFPIPGLLREAIGAETAHVLRGVRLEERFDEQPADACGAGDAVRVAAAGHHETADARALTENEISVRRERRPSFADPALRGAARLREQGREPRLEVLQPLPVCHNRRSVLLQPV